MLGGLACNHVPDRFVIIDAADRQNPAVGFLTAAVLHKLNPLTMIKRFLFIVAGLIAMTAPTASAQRRSSNGPHPVELGIDGGITFGLDDPKVTVVSLPAQDFRVGFFMSDFLEIEPRFGLTSVHTAGNSLTTYNVEFGVLYMPSGDRVGKGVYLRPFLGISGVSASGGGSNNSGFAGIGAGLKIPLENRRLATRLEANYAHGFDNGGSNQIGLLFGLSFYTR